LEQEMLKALDEIVNGELHIVSFILKFSGRICLFRWSRNQLETRKLNLERINQIA